MFNSNDFLPRSCEVSGVFIIFHKIILMYSEKQLVEFGNFLLSKERNSNFRRNEFKDTPTLSVKERRGMVHDSDLANWKVKSTSDTAN